MSSRADRRRAQTRRRRSALLIVAAGAVLAVACAIGLVLLGRGPSAPVSAGPPPTAAPTASATPTADPGVPGWLTWEYTWATLTVEAAGIVDAPITPIRDGELITKEVIDSSGAVSTQEVVKPLDKNDIVWAARPDLSGDYAPYQPWLPYGSALSASAASTSFLYCEDFADGTAICSTIFDVMEPGDIATVRTGSGETLEYELQWKQHVPKGDVSGLEELTVNVAGRLVVVTCNSEGARDDGGAPVDNSILVLQLR